MPELPEVETVRMPKGSDRVVLHLRMTGCLLLAPTEYPEEKHTHIMFDSDFTAEYLSAKLGRRKQALKERPMEQNVIAGIGNIYSDEILFTARMNPASPANSLTLPELVTENAYNTNRAFS